MSTDLEAQGEKVIEAVILEKRKKG